MFSLRNFFSDELDDILIIKKNREKVCRCETAFLPVFFPIFSRFSARLSDSSSSGAGHKSAGGFLLKFFAENLLRRLDFACKAVLGQLGQKL